MYFVAHCILDYIEHCITHCTVHYITHYMAHCITHYTHYIVHYITHYIVHCIAHYIACICCVYCSMMRFLLLNAKLLFVKEHYTDGVGLCEAYSNRVEVLSLLLSNCYLNLPTVEELSKIDNVRCEITC